MITMDEQNTIETNDRLKRINENDTIVENEQLNREIYSLKDYLQEAQDELGLRDDEIYLLQLSNEKLLKENQKLREQIREAQFNPNHPTYSIQSAMSAVTAYKVAVGIGKATTLVTLPRSTLEIWGLRAEAMKKSRILRRMIIDDKEYVLYHNNNNTFSRGWVLLNEQNKDAVLQQCIFETDRGSRLTETEVYGKYNINNIDFVILENEPQLNGHMCDDNAINL